MFRNSYNTRGSSARVGSTRPRWRTFLVALVLALAHGSAGQMPPAQAAQAGTDSAWFGLKAEPVGVEHTICVGDDVRIRVQALKRIGDEGDYKLVPHIRVDVTASAEGHGSVSPSSQAADEKGIPPGALYFTFHADDTGAAVVSFEGTIKRTNLFGYTFDSYGSVKVQNKVRFLVEDCKYRVFVNTTWRIPGPANLAFAAKINFSGLTMDSDGAYTGTAQVNWGINSGQVGDCTATETSYSQADLNAKLEKPDNIIVDIAYTPVKYGEVVNCKGVGGNLDLKLTPAPLTKTFPATGGHTQLSQVLGGPGVSGTASIIVIRLNGQ